MPFLTDDTIAELHNKADDLSDELDGLIRHNEALEEKVNELEVERSDLRAALEECLIWFQDRYDISDETDDDGTPHGNSEMAMGQMVEEWLGRGGF